MNTDPRVLRDRNPISLGPAPADARKNAARVQADIDLVNTNIDLGNIGGGGGLTEDQVNDLINAYVPVTGGVGNVVGLPVGTPYVYVSPTLTALPINISALGLRSVANGANGVGAVAAVDTANATGLGAGTVCCVGSSKIIGFNFDSGTVSNIAIPQTASAVIKWGTRLIFEVVETSPTQVHWIEGGVVTSRTLTGPSSHVIVGVGPASNGTDLLVAWAPSSVSSSLVFRTYDTAGNQTGTQTLTLPLTVTSVRPRVRIENGHVLVLYNVATGVQAAAVKDADTTDTFTDLGGGLAIDSWSINRPVNNITSTGILFIQDSSDLVRVNCATGVTEVFVDTFVNGESRFNGIHAISATKAVAVGRTGGGSAYVDVIVISGGSANVTKTDIYGANASSSTTGWSSQPVATTSGNVVFAADGVFGNLLVSVAGP